MQSGAPLFVSASSGRRAGAREPENGRWRKTDGEKKRAKLEYDSINPAIERVEWQAGGQVGTTERTFHSMNRKEEEMTKGRRGGGRTKGKASSTGDDDDDNDEIPRVVKWVD